MMATRGGVRLRAWLKERRRTQEWIAEQIGTHQTNISAWMRGRPISVDAAVRIERVTGIPVADWTVKVERGGSLPPTA